MAAATLHFLRLPRFTRRSAWRAVNAGIGWGILFTAGTAAYAWWSCGIICIDEVAITAALAMTAGVVTIGPLAAFAGRT